MNRFFSMMLAALLPALLPITAHAADNTWSGSGPFATGLGNRVINALAVRDDGTAVFCGTGSGTVFLRDIKSPTLVTNAATAITSDSAQLNGTVNVFNAESIIGFEYGLTTAYGVSVAAAPSPLSTSVDTGVSAAISSLTPGATYHYRVVTTSSVGTFSGGDLTFAVLRASQTIAFANPGAQNFGTTPTLSATASSTLAVTFTSTTPSVCAITAGGVLSFITAGPCTVDAAQAGNTTYAPAEIVSQTFIVNPVAPGAPGIGIAASGNTSARIAFTPPASNGGAAIDSYRATCSGGAPTTGSASPITVSGLTNGSAYTCTVAAHNSAGWGNESAASNSVTPSETPDFYVTPSKTGGGTISPSTQQVVMQDSTTTFTITPGSGYTAAVGGTCGGSLTGSTYTTAAITADCTVVATFTHNTYPLTIIKTGKGTVTSTPTGISCGSDCTAEYDYGTEVTLIATPTSGATFTGWSGDGCTGIGECKVTMDAQKEISATFKNPFPWLILMPGLSHDRK